MTHDNLNRRFARSSEAGQAALFLMLALGLFLLGALALAVDMGNLWFRRQVTQNAADAACTAGAMDMLKVANGGTSSGGFTPGTSFQCSSNSSASPCWYAAQNDIGANGLTAGKASSEVYVNFPSSFSGIRSCTGSPLPSVCYSSGGTAHPFIQVNVDDRVPTYFAGLLRGSTTVDVGARAMCGLVESNAPIPLLVLNPTVNGALSGNGNINITIVGGPQKSIQVNSSSSTAVSISGASGSIDLTKGGPYQTGSDFAVGGDESSVGIFTTGSSGKWVDPAGAISDPFAQVPAPSVGGAPQVPSDLKSTCAAIPCAVSGNPNSPYGTHGCQDSGGCLLYTAGLYTTDIKSFKKTLIFDPGIYYMEANLVANQQSCLRPAFGANAVGDGSGGTMFYFSGTKTIQVSANAGKYGVCGTSTKVPLSAIECIASGTGATQVPSNIQTLGGLQGNVLLGPCQPPTAGGTNYGDPLGTKDPLGEQRGMLFFQDRSANLAAAGNQPSWGGGGSFGVMGIMYFHYCNSSDGTGLGTNCDSGAYTDRLSLQGGSASSTFVIGDIVTDELSLGGNPAIEMDLNPNALYYVLKASLIQ